MEFHQHLIIAGANKCGTTSLFRYLAAHPDVTGSVIKEAGFFHGRLAPNVDEVRAAYAELFGPPESRRRVLLEGTPTYLDGGIKTAQLIRKVVPEARFIFLLREPADRLASYYRSKQGLKSAPTYGLSFEEFVELALAAESLLPENRSARQTLLLQQLAKGRYADHLESFSRVFDTGRLLVLFYDDLRADARTVAERAAAFAGIDPGFYGAYDFAVENRSRAHRSDSLRTWATHTNHRLEPFLNRFPAVRRMARSAYNLTNASGKKPETPPVRAMARLRELHREPNARLEELLTDTFGMSEFPSWLTEPSLKAKAS
jgi:hypothetical protein